MPQYIFIPDCDTFLSSTEARFVVTQPGQPSIQGIGALATFPAASNDQTIIVVPISRIAFIDALLPRVSAQKRNQLVNFAIEDKLTIDPSTVHAVVMGPSLTGSDRYIIAAISRAWLDSGLVWLQQAGVSHRLVLPETALSRVNSEEWLVLFEDGKRGTAIRPDGLAYSLDADNYSEPPFQLTLALNEAVGAESGRAAPKTLRLRIVGAESVNNKIDKERWQRCLGNQISVAIEKRTTVENVPDGILISHLKETNLLVGQFVAANRGISAFIALKPVWLLGFVILFLHSLFVSIDAWRLDNQRHQIESAMRQQFQSSFPQATSIVDPALQMARNLAALRHERGLVNDPARELLAQASTLTKALPENLVTDISRVSIARKINAQILTITFTNLSSEKQSMLQAAVSRTGFGQSSTNHASVIKSGNDLQFIITSGGRT